MTTDRPTNRPITTSIEDASEIEAQARYHLGRGVGVRDMDYLPDGRIVAYLSNVVPVDTSPDEDSAELSFVGYGPIGAAIAVPDGDGYELHMPDRDDVHAAFLRRKDHEYEHRASIIPSLLNLLKDRRELHYEEAEEYGRYELEEGDSLTSLDLEPAEFYELGRAVGMQKMASLAHRRLTSRLNAPYDGRRRWESPVYNVVRDRRTADLPVLPDDED